MHQNVELVDGLLRVRDAATCPGCNTFLENKDRQLAVIESGRIEPSRKVQRGLIFLPDYYRPKARGIKHEPVVNLWHADCMIYQFGGLETAWGSVSPYGCDRCGDRFHMKSEVMRARLGIVHYETGFFEPLPDERNETILCSECIIEVMEPSERSEMRWDPLPTNSQQERSNEPRRRTEVKRVPSYGRDPKLRGPRTRVPIGC